MTTKKSKTEKKTLAHLEQMAVWMKKHDSPEKAKEFLGKFKDPFGSNFFTFDEQKDDILKLCGGENECLLNLLDDILGTDEMTKKERRIFDCDLDGNYHLEEDKLTKYEKKYKKQFLEEANILTVYESNTYNDGTSVVVQDIYVADFTKKIVHSLEYRQEREGDEQELILSDYKEFGNKAKPKYIGYVITVGGDTGWRFGNCGAWHSGRCKVLFPFEHWNRESIKNFFKDLDKKLDTRHCFTLADLLELGDKVIEPLFKENNICTLGDYKYEEDGWTREGTHNHLGAKTLRTKDIELIDFNDLPKEEGSK